MFITDPFFASLKLRQAEIRQETTLCLNEILQRQENHNNDNSSHQEEQKQEGIKANQDTQSSSSSLTLEEDNIEEFSHSPDENLIVCNKNLENIECQVSENCPRKTKEEEIVENLLLSKSDRCRSERQGKRKRKTRKSCSNALRRLSLQFKMSLWDAKVRVYHL